jgi:thiaminase/transcriptional activator TenA
VREQIQLMDQLGARAKAEEQRLMRSHFLLSSRYEFLFWDQAYHLEKWPV